MGMERVLLLFDESRPFWTEELIELAGEDPTAAVSLEKEGYLENLEGGFCLTGGAGGLPPLGRGILPGVPAGGKARRPRAGGPEAEDSAAL